MKILTNILTLTALVAAMTSCSSVLDKKIDKATIETDIEEIKTQIPDLDSTKIEFLFELLADSKGREPKEPSDIFFNYLKANEITYRDLFSEIDSLNALREIDNYSDQKFKEDFPILFKHTEKVTARYEYLINN